MYRKLIVHLAYIVQAVISALIGATEFEVAARLWKINKKECWIFFGAFFGVFDVFQKIKNIRA